MGEKINYDYEVVSDISHRRRLIKTGWRVRGRRTKVRLRREESQCMWSIYHAPGSVPGAFTYHISSFNPLILQLSKLRLSG